MSATRVGRVSNRPHPIHSVGRSTYMALAQVV